MRLLCLAPAKVNLCLFLGGVRSSDGRHELVTLFESLDLWDRLELETLTPGRDDEVVCPGVEGENLAARALDELRARGWDGPPVRVSIEKRIPVAAGMAGGSADAAATLRLAMAIAPGRAEEVEAVAASLGADVPGQLLPGLALGTGAGELVEPYPSLAPHAFVVIPSTEMLATPAVFHEADRLGSPRPIDELAERLERVRAVLRSASALPGELIVNDLQDAAVSLCPPVAAALEAALEQGAAQAIVSGSGPTVIGIWWGAGAAEQAARAAERLRGRFPDAVSARPVAEGVALPELLG